MGKTSIEWTDASWNPIVGCTEVSPGCANCYAARLAITRLKNTEAYGELATWENTPEKPHARWTGQVRFLPERLEEPLHWKEPRKIFVCDMGDLFHEEVPVETIASVFIVMRDCPQHTFQILTKRPKRMLEILGNDSPYSKNPLPNVWLGVSVENEPATKRIPFLLATPAAVHWISAEPLLAAIDLTNIRRANGNGCFSALLDHTLDGRASPRLDWVVCGGESGPNARPMHPDWARSLRDQCVAAGVPFFFKQWGEWAPRTPDTISLPILNVSGSLADNGKTAMFRWGKKRAGRLLDGRTWDEFPDAH